MTLNEKKIILCELRTELMRYAALALTSESNLDKLMFAFMCAGKKMNIQAVLATPVLKEGVPPGVNGICWAVSEPEFIHDPLGRKIIVRSNFVPDYFHEIKKPNTK